MKGGKRPNSGRKKSAHPKKTIGIHVRVSMAEELKPILKAKVKEMESAEDMANLHSFLHVNQNTEIK